MGISGFKPSSSNQYGVYPQMLTSVSLTSKIDLPSYDDQWLLWPLKVINGLCAIQWGHTVHVPSKDEYGFRSPEILSNGWCGHL